MKNKNLKKIIVPLATVIALGVGTAMGLTDEGTKDLENGIVALSSAIATIIGAIGIFANNDK